ncbi:hypothetical protein ISREJYDI_CDS0005 [Pseudomonas phage UNO-G1W1]|jgi:hypothetical protein|uniref:Uncharacterized protein n=1 Tax=Pseudomonas phage UNO-G1W1 TaxID=3136609 RepID=A0AAX4MVJ6_9CAUD
MEFEKMVYGMMTKVELGREIERLTRMQHRYAECGLVKLAQSYAGKIVVAALVLACKD